METVKISEVPNKWLGVAVEMAQDFMERYPDRMGMADGCAYTRAGSPSFYVYRLKSMIVVRGNARDD